MKVCLLAIGLFISGLAQGEIWHFGLIGDVPYSDYERQQLPLLLNHLGEEKLAFVAHIGDIKAGKDPCDDKLYEDRYRLFNSSHHPFVFVPGDNEWTDCDRQSNGAYDPLERLNKLRSLFWRDKQSLGQKKLVLEQQTGAYPEHARFRIGPVLFVTVNLPGGNNNFGMQTAPSAEYAARNPVVLAWIKENFALARRENLRGIILLFQANPGFKHFAQGLTHRGYQDFLELLRKETFNFNGQVVAVHGDTHQSRIDHPLRDAQGKRLKRFTRVETHGYPLMGWTRGSIDTDNPALLSFSAHSWPPKAP